MKRMIKNANTTKKCPYCAEENEASAILCRFCKNYLADKPPNPHPKKDNYLTLDRMIRFGLMTVLLIGLLKPWLMQAWRVPVYPQSGFSNLNNLDAAMLLHLTLFTVLPHISTKNKNFLYIMGGLYILIEGIFCCNYYLGVNPRPSYVGTGYYIALAGSLGILIYGILSAILNHPRNNFL